LTMIYLVDHQNFETLTTPKINVQTVEKGSQTERCAEADKPQLQSQSQFQSPSPSSSPFQSQSSQSSKSNVLPKWLDLITVKTKPDEHSPSVCQRIDETFKQLEHAGFEWTKDSMLKVLKDLGEVETLLQDLENCDIFDE
ncbi:hypothetical protein DFH28DRAFT_867887, partial [Melampsora americana]